MKKIFNTIESVIGDLRKGRMIIVVKRSRALMRTTDRGL